MKIFTIGFTKKSAQKFFSLLQGAGVRRIIDVRLNNVSQLAGFAKRDDLRYFAKAICEIEYCEAPELAPTQDILDEYKKNKGDWGVYEQKFMHLMSERRIEESTSKYFVDGGCLLCSENTPHHCHRRLVAEYLRNKGADIEVKHLF